MAITAAQRKLIDQAASYWFVTLQSPVLTPEQEKTFFAWLESSPLHQAAYIRAEQIWQRGGVLGQLDLQANARTSPPLSKSYAVQFSALAACLLIAVVFGIQVLITPTSDPTPALYSTAVGEQRKVTLADGSTLHLNTNSQVAVDMTGQYRRVKLQLGEVFFNISKDPPRPFDVMTQHGTVRVLGTQFSVFDSGSDIAVTVLEGRVALKAGTAQSEQAFQADVTLTDNQQLTLREAANNAAPRPVDAQ